jgi:adenine-specific DNA-methyltransferase
MEQLALGQASPRAFRPVHYLGCKLRILEVLDAVIDDVDPSGGGLLDLFAGSGVVAAHFAAKRPVFAADIQEYSRVLAAALLAPEALSGDQTRKVLAAPARSSAEITALVRHEKRAVASAASGDADPLCAIVEHGSVAASMREPRAVDSDLAAALQDAAVRIPSTPDTVITRFYGGVYFAYDQARILDCLASAARTLPQPQREVALAAVMSTASEIVSSVGNQFAQPLRPRDREGRPKTEALRMLMRRRSVSVADVFVGWLDRYGRFASQANSGIALRGDFLEVLAKPPGEIAVVYADPPYTRDHYSRYYHVLETIARGDEPELSTMRLASEDRISRGLYRTERHQSPFCVKSQAPGAFRQLCAGARNLDAPLVISYSPHGDGSATRPRLMTIEGIAEIAADFYADVEVMSAGSVAHSKLNASRLNSDVVYDGEILIVCR